MARKYLLAMFKKEKLLLSFPLVYMIPVIILIFVNIINSYGNIYQNYRFLANSNFSYMYDEQPLTDNSFYTENWILQGNYSEKKSIAGVEFYDTLSGSNIYFFYASDALEYSYFTNKNLLRGELPNNENYKECVNQNLYPICITDTMANDLEVDLGGEIVYIYNYRDEEENEREIRVNFKVIGILYPDGRSSSEFKTSKINGSPTSCAMVSKDILENIAKIKDYSETPYIRFSNYQEGNYALSREQMLESLPISNAYVFDLIFVSVVVFIISSFTLKTIINKFSKDTVNLHKVGMRKINISMVYFIQCSVILLISIAVSVSFIKFFYLPFIAIDYLDWFLLLIVSLIIFIAGSIYNLIFSIIKTRFS